MTMLRLPQVHRPSILAILGLCLASPSVSADQNRLASSDYGDRRLSEHLVYPAEAFHHQGHGGRILDVTKPPFEAKGDGVTDDTQALIAAYDMVADAIREPHWQQNSSSYIIYLPKGTYLVSNTIIHSLPRVAKYAGRGWGGVTRVRIVGQSRDETVIRLKDRCPGFEAGQNKRVLSFQYEPGTNVPGENLCCNLTVNTGRGNPGAVGIMFHGANLSEIGNVTIESEDGAGAVGLDFALFSMQGHCRDITVSGFDFGVRVVPYAECNPTLEYVTLTGQSKAGIRVEDGSPCIRKLWSRNSVPALHMIKTKQPSAQVVLIDSRLEGGVPAQAAIRVDTPRAQLFARNVDVQGYATSIRRDGQDVVQGKISEYVSGPVLTLFEGQPGKSLALPIEDAPLVPREQNLAQWANADSATSGTTEQKIQSALDSNRSSVYFPGNNYTFQQVTVPATVQHIDFLFARLRGGTILVDEPSDIPLWIDNCMGRARVILEAPRTLVMRNCRQLTYDVRHKQPNKVFLETCVDVSGSPTACRPGIRVWARSINNEHKKTSNFKVYGGTMWVLGYKTEGHQPSFEVRDGGWCEVLGGYRNETTPDEGLPTVINRNSNVSYVGYSSMSRVYEQAIHETRNGQTRRLTKEQLPVRSGKDMFVPLYVGRSSRGPTGD